MRVLLNELERIASHMIWLGTHALDIGAMSVFFYTWQDRDLVLEIKEHLVRRPHENLVDLSGRTARPRPGGLDGSA